MPNSTLSVSLQEDPRRASERAYVRKVAEDIDRLLEAGQTHPRMREIQIAAFLKSGYAVEDVAAGFGLAVADLKAVGE